VKAKNSKSYASLLADIQADYLQKFPDKLAVIESLMQSNDWELFQTEWHKLKGNGQTIGFKAISQIAEVMEQTCHLNPPSHELCRLGIELLKQLHLDQQLHLDLNLTRSAEWIRLKELATAL
jgi:HPt (histidine-containing phosphotransfer) domain-containing protein